MKLDTYEVPVGTDGRTLRVNTINIFDNGTIILDNGNSNSKKIKTRGAQVEETARDFSLAIANEKISSVEPVIEKPVIVEEPRVAMPEVGHRYSFETAMEEPVVEDRPVTSTPYQRPVAQEAYKNESVAQYQYNNLYNKLDPVEKLREDFKRTEEGTYAHKVLKIGISKVSKYDNLLEENDRNHVALEEELKILQAKLEANKNERNSIEKEKRDNANAVADAYKQACQLDAYDKATREAEIKRQQEEAARKAQMEAEQRATAAKRAEMLARIPSELQEEPAKTPVSVQNTGVFSKFRDMEDEVEKFDFKKGGRAA